MTSNQLMVHAVGQIVSDLHILDLSGDYTREAGAQVVPNYLSVHRTLVTGNWGACKVSCDDGEQ